MWGAWHSVLAAAAARASFQQRADFWMRMKALLLIIWHLRTGHGFRVLDIHVCSQAPPKPAMPSLHEALSGFEALRVQLLRGNSCQKVLILDTSYWTVPCHPHTKHFCSDRRFDLGRWNASDVQNNNTKQMER